MKISDSENRLSLARVKNIAMMNGESRQRTRVRRSLLRANLWLLPDDLNKLAKKKAALIGRR